MALALTTKTDAVNQMLESIGERPVNSITDPGRLDVVVALSTLDEISREIQKRGWWFNRRVELELTPALGEFILPTNTLKILRLRLGAGGLNFPRALDKRYVQRTDFSDNKQKLYNLTDATFAGNTETVIVDLVLGLDFEEMPESARAYVAKRAAITFQSRRVGSTTIHQFAEFEAREAWVALNREEAEFEAEEGTLMDGPMLADLITRR